MGSTATRAATELKEAATEVANLANGAAGEHARRSLAEARACAEDLAASGSAALHKGSVRARRAIARASSETAHYVQEKPLQSLLIATAAGAALALVLGAVNKRRQS